jgi:peptidoglycan/LPS O-acetylase OafA/YrhL
MKLEHPYIGPAPTALAASPSDHPAYRADIDGLRAVAVLSVVLFHAFPQWLRGGFTGVDIFFVISGYLITAILAKSLGQGSFTFRDFYARRVRRIFPALTVVLVACLVFGWTALFPDELRQLGKHILGGAGFGANLVLLFEVGYFDTAAETKPLLHLWSLGIEEQFYIAWPIVLLVAYKRRWNMLRTTLVLAALSFIANVVLIAKYPSATFYVPGTRAWELLAGAALALATLDPANRLHRLGAGARNAISVAGLACVIGGAMLIAKSKLFPGWYAAVPVLGAVMLIAAGPAALLNRWVLGNPLMVWVGLISYPLYLWHWPLLSYLQIIEGKTPAPQMRAYAVAAAVVLAVLTYWLVEKPFRHGARLARTKIAILSLAMVAVAGVGAYAFARQGLPQRPAIVENMADNEQLVVVEDKANAAACKARYGFDSMYEYCQQTDPSRAPTVALIGDSHAYHVMAGLNKHYVAQGENFAYFGTRVPYWGLPKGEDPYQHATQPMLDIVMNTAEIHTVLITTHWRLNRGSPEAIAMIDAFRDTLKRYSAAGKQVIVLSDVPLLDFQPRDCIRRAGVASSATRQHCAITNAAHDTAMRDDRAIMAEVLRDFPQVIHIDPAAALCDGQLCWAKRDGVMLYRDTNHLSYLGDLHVGKYIAAALAQRSKPAPKALQ